MSAEAVAELPERQGLCLFAHLRYGLESVKNASPPRTETFIEDFPVSRSSSPTRQDGAVKSVASEAPGMTDCDDQDRTAGTNTKIKTRYRKTAKKSKKKHSAEQADQIPAELPERALSPVNNAKDKEENGAETAAKSKKPSKKSRAVGLTKTKELNNVNKASNENPVNIRLYRTADELLQILRGEVKPEPCVSTNCVFCKLDENHMWIPEGPQKARQSSHPQPATEYDDETSVEFSKISPKKRPRDYSEPEVNAKASVYRNALGSPGAMFGGILGAKRRLINPAPVLAKRKEQFRYWRVNYANPSSRKHKIWEDDGVLVIDGNVMTLLKSDHQTYITKKMGCSQREIDQLEDDFLLIVGSKQVKILDGMTEDEFKEKLV